MTRPPTVFVVDDDGAVRRGLRLLLESADYRVEEYETADAFLSGCTPCCRGCLITDIHMPGLSGLELQAALDERQVQLPVIVLTGQADVPAAVQSLKAGAVDFIEKPFNPETLLEQVRVAMALDARRHEARARDAHRDALLERLTPRERQVVECVADGRSNKVVAIDLGISERTVELHRGRGMRKLEVRTVAELVRLLGHGGNGADTPGG